MILHSLAWANLYPTRRLCKRETICFVFPPFLVFASFLFVFLLFYVSFYFSEKTIDVGLAECWLFSHRNLSFKHEFRNMSEMVWLRDQRGFRGPK